MALIEKKIRMRGSKGEEEVLVLFDSGATYSCIQPGLAERLANLEPLPEAMEFRTAKKDTALEANHAVRLEFFIDNNRFSDEFMVIGDGLLDEVIIGAKTLQSWHMKNDLPIKRQDGNLLGWRMGRLLVTLGCMA